MSMHSSSTTLNNGRGNMTKPIAKSTGAIWSTARPSSVGGNGDSDQDVVITKSTPKLVIKALNNEPLIVAISGIVVAAIALIGVSVVFICVYRRKKTGKSTSGPAFDNYTGVSHNDDFVNTTSSEKKTQSQEVPTVVVHTVSEGIEQNSENIDLNYSEDSYVAKSSVYSLPTCVSDSNKSISGDYGYDVIASDTDDTKNNKTHCTLPSANTDDDQGVTFSGSNVKYDKTYKIVYSGIVVKYNNAYGGEHRDARIVDAYDVTYSGVDVKDNAYDVTDSERRDASRENTYDVTYSGVDVKDNAYDVTDGEHRDASRENTYDVKYSCVDVKDNAYDVTDGEHRNASRENTYDVTYSGVDVKDNAYDVTDGEHRNASRENTYDVTYSGVAVKDNAYDVTEGEHHEVHMKNT